MKKTNSNGAGRWPSALRALNHRNFRLFFAGQLVSLTGTWIQTVAQSWLVYRLTGSATLLGLVGFSGQIPVFLLAPFGGAVADRHPRRSIIIATQTASMLTALLLAALTLTGRVAVWHVYLLAGLLGVINAFDIPARQAFIVDMVGKGDFMNAIALNSSMFNGARIIGPAIAGVLVAAVGEGWCFFINGVSYIAVIAGLLAMEVKKPVRAGPQRSALFGILEGFRYVVRTGPIRALLLLLGLVSLLGMPYAVLMPIIADRILHGGASGLGLLMGASGIGALLGTLGLAMRRQLHGLETWVIFSSIGLGVSLILFSLSRSFWLSAALLIPVGSSMMVGMAASNTLIQAMVPDSLRGRVMAVYSMMFMGMAPFGALLAGLLADRVGAPMTIGIGGGASILGSLIIGSRLRALRHETRQLVVALEMAGGDPADEMTGEGNLLPSQQKEQG
ncbi:MAG TPA: MFS transporter [Candidatus Manganitrophaceae bacterium]|nr:MFS transporter [Candidatus Manganitrophaceae bacterium]